MKKIKHLITLIILMITTVCFTSCNFFFDNDENDTTSTVATPTFSLSVGTYTSSQTVKITTDTDDATIVYTTDGTTPTASHGSFYDSSVTVSKTTTLKAFAYKKGWNDSDIATVTYTITGTVATPTFNPVGETYSSAQSVTISTSTSGATIRYTTDGTTPTSSNGTLYSSPIDVSETTTLKAIAYKDGYTDSDVATTEYTINESTNNITTPESVEVSVETALDSSSGIESGELTIDSSTDEMTTDDNKLSLPDIGIGQNLLLKDSSGNVVATAYVSPEAIESGSISIDTESLALGLIRLTPVFLFLPYDTEVNFLEDCKEHSDFSQLKTYINEALKNSPENALDPETYPYIYSLASDIAIDVIEQYSLSTSSRQARSVTNTPVIGEEAQPYIADPTDHDFSVVNPKSCFYGMELDDSEAYLIEAKKSMFTIFPPQLTDPTERTFDAGDGNHSVELYKGFGTSGTSDWINPTTADGKATYGNFLKLVASVLKVTGIASASLLSDTNISYLLTRDEEMSNVDLSDVVLALCHVDSVESFLAKVITVLDENWDEIKLWIWEDTADFMSTEESMQFLDYIDSIKSVISDFGSVATGINAINTIAPFIYDLITAPGSLTYEFSVEDGIVNETSSQIPPTAIFTVSDDNPLINETITLDASSVEDDKDNSSDLEIRWDFDNDGTWDTDWSTTKIQTTSYTARGSVTILLEVKDSDGLTSTYFYTINVGSSSELKIVLTWGQSPCDLDSHIYTPSIDGTEYHIYYGNRGTLSNAPYCWLDIDDRSSYGPETIWIEKFFSGTYTYSVYNYSRSPAISTSSAHVEVINGSELVASFDVPEDLEELWWDVFTIDGTTGNVTSIDDAAASRKASISKAIDYNIINKMHSDSMPVK